MENLTARRNKLIETLKDTIKREENSYNVTIDDMVLLVLGEKRYNPFWELKLGGFELLMEDFYRVCGMIRSTVEYEKAKEKELFLSKST